MKLVKNSNAKCEFCEKFVSKYFVNNGHVICTECVKAVQEVMNEGKIENETTSVL